MKIVLLQPARAYTSAWGTSVVPWSLLYLASSLKQKTDHQVKILDLELPRHRKKPLADLLREHQADLYGITGTSYFRFAAIDLAKTIKRVHPNSKVVVGGCHFTHHASDTLTRVPEIDIVVRGEGELTIVELANALSQGAPLEGIPGLAYACEGRIVETPKRELFEDLDGLPYFEDYDPSDYTERLHGKEDIPAFSVMSSRGCPYGCIFCSKSGMKYRLRDPKRVVEEIKRGIARFNVRGVNFLDLTLSANASHVERLCQEIIDARLDISWWCESRANIDPELLGLMKRAGCVTVMVGVETIVDRVLRAINKQVRASEVFTFVESCVKAGIVPFLSFMYSLPEETYQDVRENFRGVSAFRDMGAWVPLVPTCILPGTRLEKRARELGALPPSFSWCDPYCDEFNETIGGHRHIPLYLEKLTRQDLQQIHAMDLEDQKPRQVAKFFQRSLKEKAKWLVDNYRNGRLFSRNVWSCLTPRVFASSIARRYRQRMVRRGNRDSQPVAR